MVCLVSREREEGKLCRVYQNAIALRSSLFRFFKSPLRNEAGDTESL